MGWIRAAWMSLIVSFVVLPVAAGSSAAGKRLFGWMGAEHPRSNVSSEVAWQCAGRVALRRRRALVHEWQGG